MAIIVGVFIEDDKTLLAPIEYEVFIILCIRYSLAKDASFLF